MERVKPHISKIVIPPSYVCTRDFKHTRIDGISFPSGFPFTDPWMGPDHTLRTAAAA